VTLTLILDRVEVILVQIRLKLEERTDGCTYRWTDTSEFSKSIRPLPGDNLKMVCAFNMSNE